MGGWELNGKAYEFVGIATVGWLRNTDVYDDIMQRSECISSLHYKIIVAFLSSKDF